MGSCKLPQCQFDWEFIHENAVRSYTGWNAFLDLLQDTCRSIRTRSRSRLQSIDIGFCTQGSHEVPNLNGRTFAVTGASGNLGRAVRDVLLRDGANVVRLDRSDHSGSASTNPKQTLSLGGLDI